MPGNGATDISCIFYRQALFDAVGNFHFWAESLSVKTLAKKYLW